jgi:signal transduction histidine kinase
MRHLYQKIYLTIIASLLLVVLVAGGMWRLGGGMRSVEQAFEMAGDLTAAALPTVEAPRAEQQAAIDALGRKLRLDLALFDALGRPLASYGRPLPPPPAGMATGGWLHGRLGPAWTFRLPDARWIVARAPMRHRNPAVGLVLFLGAIALAVAIAAFPIVRGLTRRLERLQTGVETLGAGRLSARVEVEGRDEVARLAASFNRAAARIEELVGAHRLLLANASHELRTPLSRLRLGIELYEQRQDEKLKAELARDIAELDLLIDEILLASRLDAAPALATETIDLLGLTAEECAHYDDCTLTGAPVMVRGDARLLRRLVRNLIDNAQRHGAPPITVTVARRDAAAEIEVADRGAGIAEAERDRVFTPFHRVGGAGQGTGQAAGQGAGQGAGLGLALVRQIARLHGGDAVVAPRPGQPSCLRVTLPAA